MLEIVLILEILGRPPKIGGPGLKPFQTNGKSAPANNLQKARRIVNVRMTRRIVNVKMPAKGDPICTFSLSGGTACPCVPVSYATASKLIRSDSYR